MLHFFPNVYLCQIPFFGNSLTTGLLISLLFLKKLATSFDLYFINLFLFIIFVFFLLFSLDLFYHYFLSFNFFVLFSLFYFKNFVFLGPYRQQCGSFQAMGRIRAVAAGLHHSHSKAGSEPHATCTTAHSNTGSLTP